MTSGGKHQALVGIVMGSDSDFPMMSEAGKMLEKFGIAYEMEVLSAHRTPARAHEYATTAVNRGLKIVIAAAGAAAHLAGVMAANTTLPVIGVPMATSTLNGLDALLATVQMPAGIPVATMAIDKAGAANAAIFAAEVLALSDSEIAKKLSRTRKIWRNQSRKKTPACRSNCCKSSDRHFVRSEIQKCLRHYFGAPTNEGAPGGRSGRWPGAGGSAGGARIHVNPVSSRIAHMVSRAFAGAITDNTARRN